MAFREHAPPAALAPWVDALWDRRFDNLSPCRVLPDGCIDIVWSDTAGASIVGPNTTAFSVSAPPGTRMAGARLRPGAATALLSIAAESVRDVRAPIEELLPSCGARLATALEVEADPVSGLRAALLAHAARAERPDPLVTTAIERLRRPDAAVATVADELGVSERQLRRRVTAAVGYGPKLLARVLRLQSALAAARGGADLARAAYDAGYADQAHFANDCLALAGAPPSSVLA